MSPGNDSAAGAACATCLQVIGTGNEWSAILTGLLVGAVVRFGPVVVEAAVRAIVTRYRKEA